MSPPDPRLIHDFLSKARRRLLLITTAQGAAIGLGLAAIARLAGWPSRASIGESVLVGIAFALAGGVLRVALTSRQRKATAIRVEERAPECRNLLITAAELLQRDRASTPHATGAYVDALVLDRALALTRTLDLPRLFPMLRTLVALVVAVLCWSGSLALPASLARLPSAPLFGRGTNDGIDGVDVTITPPPYTARATSLLHDPSRIDVLEGSHLHLVVRGTASAMEIETLRGKQALSAHGNARFEGDLVIDADGFIAITPTLVTGSVAPRRLIGVTAIPDLPPKVRVTAPGRDLQFPDAHRTLELTVEADDDIALASLRMRYTKVSGSGERFSFTDGEIPVTLTRADARHWSAHVIWRLAGIGLEPGDMVVYRAVASDGRPGVTATESDSWIVEITAPGGIAASGFELDPEEARYAISQQMVILKTERLLARKNSISAEVFADSAAQLAAEQRKVRAELSS